MRVCVLSRTLKVTGVGWYSQQISLNFLNLVKFYICKPKSTGRGSLIKKQPICGLQSIIDKCRICGTEGETIEHIISSCTVLAQSEYKKRHDIFAKIIHMNLAVNSIY
jgi:hypothetical protein